MLIFHVSVIIEKSISMVFLVANLNYNIIMDPNNINLLYNIISVHLHTSLKNE